MKQQKIKIYIYFIKCINNGAANVYVGLYNLLLLLLFIYFKTQTKSSLLL